MMIKIEKFFALIMVLISGFTFWRLTGVAGIGFDFIDEAYNILLSVYPDQIIGKMTWSGDLLQHVWKGSGEEIHKFRKMGMVILLLSNLFLSFAAWRYVLKYVARDYKYLLFFFSVSLVLPVFIYKRMEVLSPGYNWLVLVGLTIALAGIILFFSGSVEKRLSPIVLGFGGVLVFLAKPTSALFFLAAIICLALLSEIRSELFKKISLSIVFAFVIGLGSVYFLLGGLTDVIEEARIGAKYLYIMQSHSLFSGLMQVVSLSTLTLVKVFLFTQKVTIVFVVFLWLLHRVRKDSGKYFLVTAMAFSTLELFQHDISENFYTMFLFTSSSTSLVISTALAMNLKGGRWGDYSWTPFALLLLGYMATLSAIFGSNLGVAWKFVSFSSLFMFPILIFSMWAEGKLGQKFVTALVAGVIVLSGHTILERSVTSNDVFSEQRWGGELSKQTNIVNFAIGGDLSLGQNFSEYVSNIQKIAHAGGWVSGTHLLNLSGHTLGAHLAIDAPILGIPLITGGDIEDTDAILYILEKVPEEYFESAWVLASKNGATSVYPSLVLGGIFRELSCDYELVGEFPVHLREPLENGSQEMHQLWRPKTPTC